MSIRDALREGAREQAEWAAEQQAHIEHAFNSARDEVRPGAPERVAAYQAEQRPGHTGEVAFPDGKYPLTQAELVLRVENLERRVLRLGGLVEVLELVCRSLPLGEARIKQAMDQREGEQ